MRLGIDFGTTRIAVAAVDRGNYPLVAFESPDGSYWNWFPPLVAGRGSERRYGFAAWEAQANPDWSVQRSVKRLLGESGLQTTLQIGNDEVPVVLALGELATALEQALRHRSTLQIARREPIEVMLGIPANANTNQRFLTADAFRAAGFTVLGLLNEPSAASIELGHQRRRAGGGERRLVLIYDLGGGTFDASLLEVDRQTHAVAASEGITQLGGDDFDEILAEMALECVPPPADALSFSERFWLHEECRRKKEALQPNSRRVSLDLGTVRAGWAEVSVPVAAFYERCLPLVDETLHVVESLIDRIVRDSNDLNRIDELYVIGGASELPLVSRRLRERFGRRVRRSTYSRAATAIGLAIQADAESGYVLRDRFTRHFGVWREADEGKQPVFDPIFFKGMPLPAADDVPLEITRRYHPAHNIGHFRFLECSDLARDGAPAGDVTTWDEIRIPFDPRLRDTTDLARIPVVRTGPAADQDVAESYTCDASGTLHIRVSNVARGEDQTFRLTRSGDSRPVQRPRRRKVMPKSIES